MGSYCSLPSTALLFPKANLLDYLLSLIESVALASTVDDCLSKEFERILSSAIDKFGNNASDIVVDYAKQVVKYSGDIPWEKIPYWKGAGPTAGVLGRNGLSKSSQAINNYNPPGGGIEFIFDTESATFLVGKPISVISGLSPHENLAATITKNIGSKKIVGGMFSRGADGKIKLNQNSGHYGRNWTPEFEQKFVDKMKEYGIDADLGGFQP